MKFLVIYNTVKETGALLAEQVSAVLKGLDQDVDLNEFSKDSDTIIPDNTDIVIVIGGDGTILKIAKEAAIHNCPVLGINAGHLGYLASLNNENIETIKRLAVGDYKIEKRVMLKAEKYSSGKLVDSCECLNDAVISKDSLSNVIDIDLTIGNDTINYRADGIISATPTGSTAYSLSAGGPVVDPQMKCVVITPVCPHTLVTRSLVVDGNTPIKIKVCGSGENIINLMCDGRKAFTVEPNSEIQISISDTTAKFIKLNDVSVYKVLSTKTDSY
ncbi:MAG: NAD(+)/NADH kinase [Clostridia bacterium]|nr:NAD(+)/NADH kinase [Clostridia bacterium]MBO5913344.1 NAD(+)/NADH kinase [Clostridia bacterium]